MHVLFLGLHSSRAPLALRERAAFAAPAGAAASVAECARVAEAFVLSTCNRVELYAAVRAAELRIDHSEAGLYLWVTRDEDCWATIDWLAGLGIVAAPGSFYGPAGTRHVRMALTATDERIDAAAERLAG